MTSFIGLLFWFLSNEDMAKFSTVFIAALSSLVGLITFFTRLGDRKK